MEPFIGQITMFAGTFAPLGWAFCNGQLMDIGANTALYSLLGTTYGGDGIQTFALPNLQCRLPVHQGTGGGLSPYTLGQAAGVPEVTLLLGQMPAHNHVFNATATTADSKTIGGALLPAIPTTGQSPSFYTQPTQGIAPNVKSLAAGSCGSGGNSLPHKNEMPSLCVSFVIALEGVYPSQN
jgi:microcystin-dependent protein